MTANLKPLWIEPVINGDEISNNLAGVEKALEDHKGKVLAVFSTTSCFAPRAYDKVVDLAQLCKKHDVFHVVNNAYGLSCSKITQELTDANNKGRVDVLISSTDKNFMVPVGGSIIYGPKKKSIVEKINNFYPGRANGGPI